jgi:hypothetical protein
VDAGRDRPLKIPGIRVPGRAAGELPRPGPQSQHNEKLDRHEASLTAAHGKLDQIITMIGRLLDGNGSGR